MKQTRLIPFDIEKAKNGAKIVTRHGLYPVRIGFYDLEDTDLPIVAAIKKDGKEIPYQFTIEGNFYPNKEEDGYDLFIEEEVENNFKNQDEAIRKSLIDYFQSFPYKSIKDTNINIKDVITWLEKQSDTADNKPKFKKGDWVTDIDKPGVVYQITDVVKNVTNHTYGYNAVSFTYGVFGYSYFSEKVKSMRLWDINDAKDGDVLAVNNDVFIYAHRKQMYPIAVAHCFVNSAGGFYLDGEFVYTEGGNSIYPATKEQRNLLFQKIKEEGYEWNSSTKELKKIDAFPAEKDTKIRSMTNQELADWLRKCPEEFREFTFKDGASWVYSYLDYLESEADVPVEKNKLIRRNHGEWQEPLIEE